MDALVGLIAAREVKRQYIAMAHRTWQGAETRHVDAPIGRDPRNRLRMAVVDLQRHPGKPARTLVEALDSGQLRDGIDLEEVRDVLWNYLEIDTYERLVLTQGWPLKRYSDWLTRAITCAICG